jgi:hypothetical protein
MVGDRLARLSMPPEWKAVSSSPQQRIVVLGASNVARSFARIVTTAQHRWGAPVEIMAAFGHGRSYGCESRVLGRKISGICSCELWDELTRRAALPTFALVTDIGNDILYGRTPRQLLGWVAECLDRLSDFGAQTVITGLPINSIERIGKARFSLFRTFLFPSSRLPLEVAQAHAREVNAGLLTLAEERKSTVFPVRNEWYGFDPIHIRRYVAGLAWQEIFVAEQAIKAQQRSRHNTIWHTAYVRSLPPLERSLWGVARRRAQPSGILRDGTTISLY